MEPSAFSASRGTTARNSGVPQRRITFGDRFGSLRPRRTVVQAPFCVPAYSDLSERCIFVRHKRARAHYDAAACIYRVVGRRSAVAMVRFCFSFSFLFFSASLFSLRFSRLSFWHTRQFFCAAFSRLTAPRRISQHCDRSSQACSQLPPETKAYSRFFPHN